MTTLHAVSETTSPEMLGTCPLPNSQYDHILLGHGSGGTLSNDLIRKVFLPGFGGKTLARLEDQATLELSGFRIPASEEKNRGADGFPSTAALPNPRIAFTTDSFVVRPLFFPGGDLGKLAVHGTVNDLAVGGAKPICLSAAFILEEGLPLEDLKRIVASMRSACEEAQVELVTGDTKVVDRGKGDQIFISTAGIGLVPPGLNLSIANAKPGDAVLLSGTIGDHGVAIMSVREGIEFETILESDSAPLTDLVRVMLQACPEIHCMRDPTRGGISSTLNELADASKVGVVLDESKIPIKTEVRSACDMLGLDPLYVANEGKLVAVVPENHACQVLAAMRAHPLGKNSAIVGRITDDHPGLVVLRTLIGGERVVTMLTGEQLPRIC